MRFSVPLWIALLAGSITLATRSAAASEDCVVCNRYLEDLTDLLASTTHGVRHPRGICRSGGDAVHPRHAALCEAQVTHFGSDAVTVLLSSAPHVLCSPGSAAGCPSATDGERIGNEENDEFDNDQDDEDHDDGDDDDDDDADDDDNDNDDGGYEDEGDDDDAEASEAALATAARNGGGVPANAAHALARRREARANMRAAAAKKRHAAILRRRAAVAKRKQARALKRGAALKTRAEKEQARKDAAKKAAAAKKAKAKLLEDIHGINWDEVTDQDDGLEGVKPTSAAEIKRQIRARELRGRLKRKQAWEAKMDRLRREQEIKAAEWKRKNVPRKVVQEIKYDYGKPYAPPETSTFKKAKEIARAKSLYAMLSNDMKFSRMMDDHQADETIANFDKMLDWDAADKLGDGDGGNIGRAGLSSGMVDNPSVNDGPDLTSLLPYVAGGLLKNVDG